VYANNIARLRVNDQFTRALSLRAIVQYDRLAVSRELTRLPQRRNLLDPALVSTPFGLARTSSLANDGWQVFTKLSYLLRR
jgi:hypothetical protein